MKEKLISVVALLFMTAPGLASAEITDSFNGSIGLGAIVIDSGNNLNPEGSKKRLDNLSSAADPVTTFLPAILPEVTGMPGNQKGLGFT